MKSNSKKVILLTYGCQMNEYDSELIRSILMRAGYVLTANESEADIVMLNTCSVRENAHRKVFGNIHEIRHRRNGRPVLIGILGCMATALRKELLDNKSLALDFVVGPDNYKRLPDMLRSVMAGYGKGYDVTLSEFENYAEIYPARTSGVNAWVAVMRGCNHFCSYCIVPFTRGRERSRPLSNILDEVRRLADDGFQQVTLLGQNVNSYRYEDRDFADLLDAVAAVKGIRRIRFTSPHPQDFPEGLIRVLAENPKVCKQVHLPLQSGNDRVLALMGRNYTQSGFIALAQRLRRICPQMALSTDVIVGFPTETGNDFEDTLRVMQEVRFDTAFMFKYSVRSHTKAARELQDDVPDRTKTDRIVRLNMIQTDIALERNKALVGHTQEILIESEPLSRKASVYGRNDANKIVSLTQGDFAPGQFVQARIIRATPHQLKGEPTLS